MAYPNEFLTDASLIGTIGDNNLTNPTPVGASRGELLIGIGTTAMGALAAIQAGLPIPLVVTDLYSGKGRPR